MNYSMPVSILSFVLYISGGIASFSGIALFMTNRPTTGFWLLSGGILACIWGVLMLRIIRNRTDRLLRTAVRS